MGGIRILAGLVLAGTLPAGVLVTRSDQGLQFTRAESILVQGKDKVLSLGKDAKPRGPAGKLPSVPLAGAILFDADSATPALYKTGELEFLLPSGLPKTATGDPDALWKTVRISYKKGPSDKAPAEIPGRFVAFIPGGVEELAATCADDKAMETLGGRGKAFPTQLEWVAAVVRAFPAEPGVASLEQYVAKGMRQRLESIESGTAGGQLLQQALDLAALSQQIYPAQPEQQRLRTAVTSRKAWLDRKRATLRAFAASGEWDSLLAAARDTEVYEQAFPELLQQRNEALKQSLQKHRQAGHDRVAEGEYGAAYREFRLAALRQPSDAALQEESRLAWTEYSRRAAVDRQGKRESLGAGSRDSVDRDLYFAEQNRRAKNLEESLTNLQHAEATLAKALPGDKHSAETLKVLYKKAEVLASQGRLSDALGILTQHDLIAVGDERQEANQLRNQLLFQMDKTLKEAKAAVRKAWAESRFHLARNLCLEGLRVKGDDAELLYQAGAASLVTRQREEGRAFLTRYLEVSNTLEQDAAQRAAVRRLLPALAVAETAAAGQGTPNWMSGRKLPADAFYCPVGLAFQPRIDHIEVSGKLRVDFDWNNGRLRSITPVFEKTEKSTGEKKLAFAYDDRVPQVASIAVDKDAASWAAADADEAALRSTLVVFNNPYLDPVAAERLTGKNMTLAIAGNRFFNPFVWEKVCYFRLTYDDLGRAIVARELTEPRGAPSGLVVEFEWKDLQLAAIRGYEGPDEGHRQKVYERKMQYRDGRLLSEEVSLQGRTSRITYVYRGDRLVSAVCDKNAHPDGRSRQVTFTSN